MRSRALKLMGLGLVAISVGVWVSRALVNTRFAVAGKVYEAPDMESALELSRIDAVLADVSKAIRVPYPAPRLRAVVSGGAGNTVNKGVIEICLQHGTEHARLAVALHEFAHVLNPGFGHDDNFHRIHKLLVSAAVQLGHIAPFEDTQMCGSTVRFLA